LRQKGVEFDAVNLQDDPDEVDKLALVGMSALPVVAVAGRYVMGANRADVDRLLDLAHQPESLLDAAALVDRTTRLLAAAARYARQIPAERVDEPIPGMEDVDGPLLLADGTPVLGPDGRPFVPHRTQLGLVRHIAGHGAKFLLLASDRAAGEYAAMATYLPFGEPSDDLGPHALADILETAVADIASWWRTTRDAPLDQMLETFWGTHTLRSVLNDNTYSLAQHVRQLMALLVDAVIRPNGPLGVDDFHGITLPERIWD
jgi:hypothetical protein